MERGSFEIRRIDRKNLPSGHLLAQDLDGSHVGKLQPQTLVMFFGRGQPHSVVQRSGRLVTKDEDNFFLNINRKAAEHGSSPRRQRSNGIQDKRKRDGLARLHAEEGVIERK